ncbi:fimbrial protein [Pseudomonas sp.]|uniref:fimbrial protein n=1 Tax=Pseudomonas sp. TaxID=306 RepID=UPI001B1D9DAD|nr:fimbrial protein [Pseudomonas sp.]MBO9549832.1 type 1 fimbrial protein [Pseudomonas sp.]
MIQFTHATLTLGVLLSLTWPASQALADASSYCFYEDKSKATVTFESKIPPTYIPLNASIGTEVGKTQVLYASTLENRILNCYNDGTDVMRFRMTPIHPPLVLPGTRGNGEVLPTGIKGIGARIQLFGPFDGQAAPSFRPEDDHTWVPFTAIRDRRHGLADFRLQLLFYQVTLVKTGELEPGDHEIDRDMFIGNLDFGGIGNAFKFRLKGEVIQTHCTIGTDPVTPNPVPLGDFSRSEFTHVGYTTTKVDFRITLAACQTDPDNNTYATLELKTPDALIGPGQSSVFGLTKDSDAAGVGIQVFKGDGSPMPLNTEEPMTPLSKGTTVLNLQASFHQIEPSRAVRAGIAKGQLNFIVRYR